MNETATGSSERAKLSGARVASKRTGVAGNAADMQHEAQALQDPLECLPVAADLSPSPWLAAPAW